MAVTLHFCLPNFRMQSMVLRTVVFTQTHTCENIAEESKEILKQYGLDNKYVIYITDQGSNIVKARRGRRI